MNVFILAAGSQKRWQKGNPEYPIKQLVPIDGEPLLDRTIRQLKERGYDARVITHRKELMRDNYIHPVDNSYTVTSIMSAVSHSGKKNLVLLGDVYFTEEAMDTCLNLSGKIRFAGGGDEIFAVYWEDDAFILKHLSKAIGYAQKKGRIAPGRLWSLYRSVIGVPMREHKHDERFYVMIKDGSTDFDEWKEYTRWLKENEIVTE